MCRSQSLFKTKSVEFKSVLQFAFAACDRLCFWRNIPFSGANRKARKKIIVIRTTMVGAGALLM